MSCCSLGWACPCRRCQTLMVAGSLAGDPFPGGSPAGGRHRHLGGGRRDLVPGRAGLRLPRYGRPVPPVDQRPPPVVVSSSPVFHRRPAIAAPCACVPARFRLRRRVRAALWPGLPQLFNRQLDVPGRNQVRPLQGSRRAGGGAPAPALRRLAGLEILAEAPLPAACRHSHISPENSWRRWCRQPRSSSTCAGR